MIEQHHDPREISTVWTPVEASPRRPTVWHHAVTFGTLVAILLGTLGGIVAIHNAGRDAGVTVAGRAD